MKIYSRFYIVVYMKKFNWITICLFVFSFCSAQNSLAQLETTNNGKTWELIFNDDFNINPGFDTTKWSYCQRGNAAWTKFLAPSSDYAFSKDGNLVLMMNSKLIAGDNLPYHCGGLNTVGKFTFLYGKVVVKAKFTKGKGSWPAIWMMPENSTYGGWPKSGEIDIMEHVNNEDVIHQTIHNAAVTDASGGSVVTKAVPYIPGEYNLYGIIWAKDKIEFYVNDTLTYTYSKPVNATSRDWPFNQPFHLIVNQSGGAGWPGSIITSDLPFNMKVDWVKVYQLKS
jgi:beta-glucanase (GH16 family)